MTEPEGMKSAEYALRQATAAVAESHKCCRGCGMALAEDLLTKTVEYTRLQVEETLDCE